MSHKIAHDSVSLSLVALMGASSYFVGRHGLDQDSVADFAGGVVQVLTVSSATSTNTSIVQRVANTTGGDDFEILPDPAREAAASASRPNRAQEADEYAAIRAFNEARAVGGRTDVSSGTAISTLRTSS